MRSRLTLPLGGDVDGPDHAIATAADGATLTMTVAMWGMSARGRIHIIVRPMCAAHCWEVAIARREKQNAARTSCGALLCLLRNERKRLPVIAKRNRPEWYFS